jgi:large subunit ribosomal protein L30
LRQLDDVGAGTMAKKATTIRIIQVRSLIGRPQVQREVVRGLGLRRIRHVVERPDTRAIRGMIAKVPHLVEIVEDKP